MLAPHVDYSPVLAVRSDVVATLSFWERFGQFARPFAWEVWVVLTVR